MASTSSSWPESTTTGTLGECSIRRRKVSAPWLSGRFRSKSTSDGVSLDREARPSDSRLTQFTFTGNWPSTRRRRTRSASPGLSSMSNTFVVCGFIICLFSSWWQSGRAKPELFNGLHRGKKFIQISRLANIAIGPQFITAGHILAELGGAKDDDRDAAQVGTGLHRGQDCQAPSLGQIQVQDHQVGPDRIGIFVAAIQESQRFDPVLHAVDLAAGRAYF